MDTSRCVQEAPFSAIMQDVYSKYIDAILDGAVIYSADSIVIAREVTGIAPESQTMQRLYERLIQAYRFHVVAEYKKASGVKPDNDIIQRGFRTTIDQYLKASDRDHMRTREHELNSCLETIDHLIAVGEIHPPEDYVQETYAALLKKEAVKDAFALSMCLDRRISKDIRRDAFTDYLMKGLYDPFEALKKKANIVFKTAAAHYDYLDSKAVSFRLEQEAKEGKMASLLAWRNLLETDFPDKVKHLIQEHYRNLLLKR